LARARAQRQLLLARRESFRRRMRPGKQSAFIVRR
jgi:hypothetical protein